MGEAEIRDPQMPVGVDDQVRGLDVAVDDAQLVGVFQGLSRLDAQASNRSEKAGRVGRSPGRNVRLRAAVSRGSRRVYRGAGKLTAASRLAAGGLRLRFREVRCDGVARLLRVLFSHRLTAGACPDTHPRFLDQRGKGPALDVLHRIIVHAPFASDRVDVHDIRVFEGCSGLGFVLEPLQLSRVQDGGKRQHFEGHASLERNLLGFAHHAHPAAADLAEDEPEIPRPAAAPAAGKARETTTPLTGLIGTIGRTDLRGPALIGGLL